MKHNEDPEVRAMMLQCTNDLRAILKEVGKIEDVKIRRSIDRAINGSIEKISTFLTSKKDTFPSTIDYLVDHLQDVLSADEICLHVADQFRSQEFVKSLDFARVIILDRAILEATRPLRLHYLKDTYGAGAVELAGGSVCRRTELHLAFTGAVVEADKILRGE